MQTENGNSLPSQDRRQPFAILNLTWVVAIAATLAVLAKVYSVSGLSTDGAMQLLRTADVIHILIGTVVSDYQVVSVIILVFVLALYMEAEWPVSGRHEREVNLLGTVLVVSWLIVIAVAPWVIAAIALLMGMSFLAGRTGPVHFLAWRGVLGRRLQSKLEEDRMRSAFRRSLPQAAMEALERGDVTTALRQIDNPPAFAEEELSRVADAYSPSIGVRRTQGTVARVAIFLSVVALVGLIVSPRPWVPAELIKVGNDKAQAGYVLGEDQGRLVVIWVKPKRMDLIDSDSVSSRVVCQKGITYRTLPQVVGLVEAVNYSRCE